MLIFRYILKSHIGPFFFALGTLMFLFLFQFLIKSIDQLIGKGLSLWIITQLIALNLAWMVTLAVPMAVLVSTLMAFGGLSSENEITIMKASGISLKKLMMPVLIMAAVITYLMVLFNNDVLPDANHQARILLQDISRTKPTFILEPGKFSDDIGGAKILVRKTFENSNRIEGIYIYDYSSPEYRNVITAERGNIGFTSDFKNIILNLESGEIHQLNTRDYYNKYRRVSFTTHRIILDAAGFGFKRSSDNVFIRGDRELSADAMNKIVDSINIQKQESERILIETIRREIRELNSFKLKDTLLTKSEEIKDNKKEAEKKEGVLTGKQTLADSLFTVYRKFISKMAVIKSQVQSNIQVEKQIDAYNVEIYKKYSIPFACLVFALIGGPLGYRVRRGGFGIASGFSLLFFLMYWAALIGGEKLADRGLVTPFLGMWLVNIILGFFGLYLMFKSS